MESVVDGRFDVLVIGGGIAGVSLGFELAAERSVGLLEMESTLAFHTTGRSAATWLGTYGNGPIRALTAASHEFLTAPPEGLFEADLTRPLGLIYIGGPGQADLVRALHDEVVGLSPEVELVDAPAARELFPLLRPDHVELAMVEPGALDVDVHELHQGYTRGLRARGGKVITSEPVRTAAHDGGGWTVTTGKGDTFCAPVVINAAGAWVDRVAAIFAASPIGIRPLRRTMFTVPDAVGAPPHLPMVFAVDHAFYVKSEAGQFLCSPQDETLQEPGDAKPDELEIARAIDAINDATTLNVRHIRGPWAGLRNFTADETPAVGFDPNVEGFYWYAGQGGYGIQAAPALARVAAAQLLGRSVPHDVIATGLDVAVLDPERFSR